MPRPKPLSAPALVIAEQIGRILKTAATQAGNSRDAARIEASDWWKAHLDHITEKHLPKQQEVSK